MNIIKKFLCCISFITAASVSFGYLTIEEVFREARTTEGELRSLELLEKAEGIVQKANEEANAQKDDICHIALANMVALASMPSYTLSERIENVLKKAQTKVAMAIRNEIAKRRREMR
jgi:hypothetical protein